jgi:ABC-type transport system substrate-binding protein
MRRTLLVIFSIVAIVGLTFSYVAITPVSAGGPRAHMIQIDINHKASFWGVPMDCKVGSPGWHIRAAIAHLLDKQQFVNDYAPGMKVIDNPVPNTSCLKAWNFRWSQLDLYFVDSLHPEAISLYNSVPLAPDYAEARDHLIAAGAGWVDNNNDGVIDNPPATKIDFYVTDSDPVRVNLGLYLEAAIEKVFGADVVNLIIAPRAVVWSTVLDTSVEDDWQLYASVWSVGVPGSPPTSWLYELYHSDFIELDYPIPTNYIFYNNTCYDSLVVPPLRIHEAWIAQYIFGATVGTIPVFSQYFPSTPS